MWSANLFDEIRSPKKEFMHQQPTVFNRGAIRPIQCLSDGHEMLKGNYGNFLGVLIVGFFIMLLGSCIPLAPLMPPMICGIYLCLLAMMNRQPFNSSTLFKGFDFFGPSFVASLVLTIPILVLTLVMQIGLGGLGAITDMLKENKSSAPEEIIPAVVGIFGFIFGIYALIIIVALVIGMLTAFVYPLVVDRKLGAIAAIKLSVRAVVGNFFGVVGLMILGQLILFAGLMLFYVGALFVAPIIFAAWAIAYRRVFPAQFSQPNAQFGAPAQQYAWTPPVSASKAGLVLTLSALAIVVCGAVGITAAGYFAYHGITEAIRKNQAERDRPLISEPTPPVSPYPASTPLRTPPGKVPASGKTVSGGVLNGKAIELPKPVYSPEAKANRVSGTITVKVEVDEKGDVTSAKVIAGLPFFSREEVEKTALAAKFSPLILGGKAVKVSGLILYRFAPE